MLGDVAVMPHSSFPQAGHLVHEGNIYPYSNLQEMQKQYNHLARLSEARRAKEDPVVHETNAAMEEIIRSVNKEVTGHRSIKETARTSAEQLKQVVARVWQGIFKATDEAPVHAPELVEEEQRGIIEQGTKADPVADQFAQRLKAANIDSAKAVTENIVGNTKSRTGISNIDGELDKLKTITIPSKARKGDASASYSMEEALGKDAVRELKRQRLKTAENLGQTINDSIAYFRNPGKKGFKMGSSARAADGTRIGMRDKREFYERLSDEKTEHFIQTLEIADGYRTPDGELTGRGIHFQDPVARILFHWGNRKHFGSDDPFVKAMQRQLEKAYNDPEKGIKYNRKQFDRAADNLARHLIYLAKSGTVNQHGGISEVFRSTNFFDEPTVWQFQLNDDVDRVEIGLMEKILEQNNPKALETMRAGIQALQVKRADAYHVEDWLRYNNMINTLMVGQITPEIQMEF
jgi:hypothetical protein